jgi:putative endonuclease
MQHKQGTLEGFTADYGCKRLLYFEGHEDIGPAIAREKQLKGWRREKNLNLIRATNPEFKDLAQTWDGDDYSAEKMHPRPSSAHGRKNPVLGLGWSKAPNSMDKISTFEVLRLRATKRGVTR